MENYKPIKFSSILAHPLIFVAFGFGSGLSPVAPGTIGTIVAFPIYWILSETMSKKIFLGMIFVFFLIGIFCCDKAGKFSGEADHSGIVWDVIVAMLLILILVPQSYLSFITAFVIFRFFDITKPWPIYISDRKYKNGFGVVFDDLLAAIYTLVCFFVYQSALH